MMREWINAVTLNEAPIGDIHTHGDFSKPGSFRADDLSLATPKRQDKIKRVLQKAPALIDLHFVNQPHQVDMGWHLDPVHARVALGFLTPDDMQARYGFSIQPRPDAVNVVMIQNEGADRVPLTPWIIAHRIGHLFLYTHQLELDALLRKFYNALDDVADFYTWKSQYQNPNWVMLAKVFGTTRACREGLIRENRLAEWAYDCFAQLCVTGSIKFNPAPLQIEQYRCQPDQLPQINERFEKLRLLLTDRYTWMLNDAVGKIMLF